MATTGVPHAWDRGDAGVAGGRVAGGFRRASIEPYAWVLNKSVLAAGTSDPLLAARLAGERKQMERLAAGLAKRIFTIPWLTVPPIGFAELSKLVAKPKGRQ